MISSEDLKKCIELLSEVSEETKSRSVTQKLLHVGYILSEELRSVKEWEKDIPDINRDENLKRVDVRKLLSDNQQLFNDNERLARNVEKLTGVIEQKLPEVQNRIETINNMIESLVNLTLPEN